MKKKTIFSVALLLGVAVLGVGGYSSICALEKERDNLMELHTESVRDMIGTYFDEFAEKYGGGTTKMTTIFGGVYIRSSIDMYNIPADQVQSACEELTAAQKTLESRLRQHDAFHHYYSPQLSVTIAPVKQADSDTARILVGVEYLGTYRAEKKWYAFF